MAGKGSAITAPKVDKRKEIGRPTTFNEEVATEICTRIALGESLRTIASAADMPPLRTIMDWLHRYESFSQHYARAKEAQADSYEDMMLHVARTEEDVNRARLIIDTMKWTASKLKPKKYGDKLDLTSDGKALPQPLLGGVTIEPSDNA